jgi:hypothetical protein
VNHKTNLTAPELTVVIIVLCGQEPLVRCLSALARQTGQFPFEIIVPCNESFQDIVAVQAKFPQVQFLSVEGYRTYAELRALGVQQAQGKIIALTEDHCLPNADWCAQILKAHKRPETAIGGAVEKGIPDTALNWALYLADFVRYMTPMPEGPSDYLTDCNVTYKRAALETIAGVWHEEFHEPDVHGALKERGQSLWFSPHIVVHQQRSVRLNDAIKDRYAFGRLFGSGRVKRATALKRFVYAALALPLPLLLVGRVAGQIFRKRRCRGAFIRALPALLLICSIWAWGELMGYLTGRAAAVLTPGQRAETVVQRVQEVSP